MCRRRNNNYNNNPTYPTYTTKATYNTQPAGLAAEMDVLRITDDTLPCDYDYDTRSLPFGSGYEYGYAKQCGCGRRRCRRSCWAYNNTYASVPRGGGIPVAMGPVFLPRRHPQCLPRLPREPRRHGVGPVSLVVGGVVGLVKVCVETSRERKAQKAQKEMEEKQTRAHRETINQTQSQTEPELDERHIHHDDEWSDEEEEKDGDDNHSYRQSQKVNAEATYRGEQPPSYDVAVGYTRARDQRQTKA